MGDLDPSKGPVNDRAAALFLAAVILVIAGVFVAGRLLI